jgi:hypothetical protein
VNSEQQSSLQATNVPWSEWKKFPVSQNDSVR